MKPEKKFPNFLDSHAESGETADLEAEQEAMTANALDTKSLDANSLQQCGVKDHVDGNVKHFISSRSETITTIYAEFEHWPIRKVCAVCQQRKSMITCNIINFGIRFRICRRCIRKSTQPVRKAFEKWILP